MQPAAREAHRQLVRELARSDEGVWITCAGRSMEPTVRLGDRVRVVASRVRVGDVVLFEGARGYVLHRVVGRIPGTSLFLHIGDAGSGDGPGLAHLSRVVGRAALPRRPPPPAVVLAAARRLARAARSVLAKIPHTGPARDTGPYSADATLGASSWPIVPPKGRPSTDM